MLTTASSCSISNSNSNNLHNLCSNITAGTTIIVITNTGPCACGRTVPRLRVLGRSDDMVVVRGINVFPTAVAAVVNEFPELSGEYRIVLGGPGPYERLPFEAELAAGHQALVDLETSLARSIKTRLSVTPEVTLLPPDSLPRTAGKTRRVIRKEKP